MGIIILQSKGSQLEYLPQISTICNLNGKREEASLAPVSSIYFTLTPDVEGKKTNPKLYLDFSLCPNSNALYYARTVDFNKIKMSPATYL